MENVSTDLWTMDSTKYRYQSSSVTKETIFDRINYNMAELETMTEDEKQKFEEDWENYWTPKMTEDNKNEI
jgi:formiminotetrahydrofolate cyclodeaminase